jgi:hypothetical protein
MSCAVCCQRSQGLGWKDSAIGILVLRTPDDISISNLPAHFGIKAALSAAIEGVEDIVVEVLIMRLVDDQHSRKAIKFDNGIELTRD